MRVCTSFIQLPGWVVRVRVFFSVLSVSVFCIDRLHSNLVDLLLMLWLAQVCRVCVRVLSFSIVWWDCGIVCGGGGMMMRRRRVCVEV